MISEELKGIVDKFKEQGKMEFLEETTEEKILSFEKEKGVTLPPKYKDWLLFSDGGELFLPAGIQLYGVEHKPLIDVNDNSRPSEDYVVIGALASGDPILFKKDSDKIINQIKNSEGNIKLQNITVGTSYGISIANNEEELNDSIAEADKAMYADKRKSKKIL